ncbi:hypothetical protein evm_001931 [Chilo suppressalis]|nr:hypothetical protein evm_001931 [Chilo suppressalis]
MSCVVASILTHDAFESVGRESFIARRQTRQTARFPTRSYPPTRASYRNRYRHRLLARRQCRRTRRRRSAARIRRPPGDHRRHSARAGAGCAEGPGAAAPAHCRGARAPALAPPAPSPRAVTGAASTAPIATTRCYWTQRVLDVTVEKRIPPLVQFTFNKLIILNVQMKNFCNIR